MHEGWFFNKSITSRLNCINWGFPTGLFERNIQGSMGQKTKEHLMKTWSAHSPTDCILSGKYWCPATLLFSCTTTEMLTQSMYWSQWRKQKFLGLGVNSSRLDWWGPCPSNSENIFVLQNLTNLNFASIEGHRKLTCLKAVQLVGNQYKWIQENGSACS